MAIDVALTLPGISHVFLVAGFCMLPRYVSAVGGWHGYKPSAAKGEQPRLSLWAVHGRRDSEITWALARRSFEALCELYGGRVALDRVEIGDDDDHWSIWDAEEMGGWLRDFCDEAGRSSSTTAVAMAATARVATARRKSSLCATASEQELRDDLDDDAVADSENVDAQQRGENVEAS